MSQLLLKRRPTNSEFLDLDAKFGKSGIGEVKTLNSIENFLRIVLKNL